MMGCRVIKLVEKTDHDLHSRSFCIENIEIPKDIIVILDHSAWRSRLRPNQNKCSNEGL